MRGRLLLAAVLVAATTTMADPLASAAPGRAAQCPSDSGVKVSATDSPATVSVTDPTTGGPVSIVVTISGATFEITAADGSTTLTDASWCVKSSTRRTDPSPSTGLTGVSPSTNKRGVVQDISYVRVYTATTGAGPILGCFDDSEGQALDLEVTGPVNTAYNAKLWYSSDGTCSGTVWTDRTWVVVDTPSSTALEICIGLGGVEFFGPARTSYPTAPAAWWLCDSTGAEQTATHGSVR